MSLVKSYRVMNLLNCMSKVVEKVVANQLSDYCKTFSKLYPGQMCHDASKGEEQRCNGADERSVY